MPFSFSQVHLHYAQATISTPVAYTRSISEPSYSISETLSGKYNGLRSISESTSISDSLSSKLSAFRSIPSAPVQYTGGGGALDGGIEVSGNYLGQIVVLNNQYITGTVTGTFNLINSAQTGNLRCKIVNGFTSGGSTENILELSATTYNVALDPLFSNVTHNFTFTGSYGAITGTVAIVFYIESTNGKGYACSRTNAGVKPINISIGNYVSKFGTWNTSITDRDFDIVFSISSLEGVSGLTDSLSAKTSAFRTINEPSISISDSLNGLVSAFRTMTESFSISDSLTGHRIVLVSLSESISGLTDTLSAMVQTIRNISESYSISDSLNAFSSYFRDFTENVGNVTDSLVSKTAINRIIPEVITISDSLIANKLRVIRRVIKLFNHFQTVKLNNKNQNVKSID